jgi:hypothetical protein
MICGVAVGKTIYVDDDAVGANNGSSWFDAYIHLQDALTSALYGDEIWVGKGLYKPDQGASQTPGDRKATFQLINGMAIKGGYAGLDGTDPYVRDFVLYETVLSGDVNSDDGPNFANNSENSYHVVTGSFTSTTAVLEGFTITGGNANDGTSRPEDDCSGGGLWNNSGSPTVRNCTFSKNSAMYGGGLGQGFDNTVLTNCIFIGNLGWRGGGMNNYDSHTIMRNCLFTGNSATADGGGMYNIHSSPTLINCTLTRNTAGRGGGLYDYDSSPILTNCIFRSNSDSSGIVESSQIYEYLGSPAVANYCCIQGWTGSLGGVGNIGNDPLLGPDDCHLQSNSLCIDAGDNSAVPSGVVIDLDGDPRFIDDPDVPDTGNGIPPIVDMGASEGYFQYFLLGLQSVTVPEGQTASFTVQLLHDPLGTVEVTVSRKSGEPDITIESGASLTFNSLNYTFPQTVVLAAAEDEDRRNDTALISVNAYRFFCGEVTASELDNEPPVVLFVDPDATGANNGLSWVNALNYLQDALSEAVSGDEIRVADGVYKPDQGVGITPGDRTATFQLINGVVIKGSYGGVGEPDPNVRDIGLYETILSGDLYGNDVDVNEPLDLWNEATRSDNSYHVVIGDGTDGTAVLDGFTIIGGSANGSSGSLIKGGGMYNHSGSPTLVSLTFTKNFSTQIGGGMYNSDGSSPILTSCTFKSNYSLAGGGILNELSSNPRLYNCIFSQNWANSAGGGMANGSSSPTMTNCTFSSNSASQRGGGVDNFSSNPVLTNCILWGDTPSEMYGGMPEVTNSDVQGGWPGEGNIDTDPFFADVNKGDYHLKSHAGRWDANSESWVQDEVTSPCIDAGDLMSPIGLEPFPNGGILNMGAYGGTPEASKSYFGEPVCETVIAGDINGDCRINFLDFRFIMLSWLEDNTPPPPPPPLPGQAISPNPADGVTDVNAFTDLSWMDGSYAMSHDVYFGTSIPLLFIGNQAATMFDPGLMIPLTKYFWRIDEVNSSGKTTGMLWSFTTSSQLPPLPGQVSNPNPADGATDVDSDTDLSWTAGSYTNSHDVYIGASLPLTFMGNQTANTFDPGLLNPLTKFYWRIDEVNSSGKTTGPVWSFTTRSGGPPPPPPP